MTERKVSSFSDPEISRHAMALKENYSLSMKEEVFDKETMQTNVEKVRQDVEEVVSRLYEVDDIVRGTARAVLNVWVQSIADHHTKYDGIIKKEE